MISPSEIGVSIGGMNKVVQHYSEFMDIDGGEFKVKVFATRNYTNGKPSHISTFVLIFKFIIYLLRCEANIVHIHVASRGSTYRKFVYAFLSKAFGKNLVLHLHGAEYKDFYREAWWVTKPIIRLFWKSADAIIVLGQPWADYIIKTMNVKVSNVHIVNNGTPEIVGGEKYKSEKVRITFMGEVCRRKGVDVLLKAICELSKSENWQLNICGGGENLEDFKSLSKDLGIQSLVNFHGWVNAETGKDILSKSDIFVLPSRAENQPVAIMEAMSHRLPVIATNVGDIPSQVINGVNGIIVDAGDVESLRLSLKSLIENEPLRISMGHASFDRHRSHFSISSNIRKTVQVYKNVSSESK